MEGLIESDTILTRIWKSSQFDEQYSTVAASSVSLSICVMKLSKAEFKQLSVDACQAPTKGSKINGKAVSNGAQPQGDMSA